MTFCIYNTLSITLEWLAQIYPSKLDHNYATIFVLFSFHKAIKTKHNNSNNFHAISWYRNPAGIHWSPVQWDGFLYWRWGSPPYRRTTVVLLLSVPRLELVYNTTLQWLHTCCSFLTENRATNTMTIPWRDYWLYSGTTVWELGFLLPCYYWALQKTEEWCISAYCPNRVVQDSNCDIVIQGGIVKTHWRKMFILRYCHTVIG